MEATMFLCYEDIAPPYTPRIKFLKIVTYCGTGNRVCTPNTFHNFTLWISRAHQTASCWPSEWVSARWSGWYSIQRIHTFPLAGQSKGKLDFISHGKWLRPVIIPKPPNETSSTQNSTGPSRLDCDPFTIYLTRTPEQSKERRSP